MPYTLRAWGGVALAECPQPPPPITPTDVRAPIGTHAIGLVAPVAALLGSILLVPDLHAAAAGAGRAGTRTF